MRATGDKGAKGDPLSLGKEALLPSDEGGTAIPWEMQGEGKGEEAGFQQEQIHSVPKETAK